MAPADRNSVESCEGMIRVIGCDQPRPEWSLLNQITPRLAAKDPSIWGETAQAEASIRLGWIDLPQSSRQLLPILDALSAWSREFGHQRFILCGMGGSSLAPEVMAKSYQRDLIVLDSTDPDQVSIAAQGDLSRTCIIIGSKSGSTIETASQRAFFTSLLKDAGLDPRNHIVVVTDPGSPFDVSARQEGLRTINADPNVGGRFSALSAFGLVPAALMGIDVSVLLDDAFDAASHFTEPDSPVVKMAALLADPKFAYVGFYDAGSNVPGLGDWIEQLIAESTGKDGRGVLPVVVESPTSKIYEVISFKESSPLAVIAPLGAQFIFWEWVTALLGYLLCVDPFNQPNVTESKERTGALLKEWSADSVDLGKPVVDSPHLEIFADINARSLAQTLRALIDKKPGYFALMAYLNREGDQKVQELRSILEEKSQRPVTFGWGPRFLHSTGQFHKGGPLVGAFIQITGEARSALPIPGAGYGFEKLVLAQALGDNQALTTRDLPVIRIHLKNREAGIEELLEAARSL